MGTSIRIEALQGEATEEIWKDFVTEFLSAYDEGHEDDDYVVSGTVYCPYSMANLASIPFDLEKYKGSGISLSLFFLEVEPDECKEL